MHLDQVEGGQDSVLQTWRKRFFSASLVASIVVLTHGFWDPLEESVITLTLPQDAMHDTWGQEPRGLERVGIVKIDKERYKTLYHGSSPLDRCQMAEDLGRLAKVPGIQTIAVDFDLSPIDKKSVDSQCQEKLDRVISDNAARLILMAPMTSQETGEDKQAIEEWLARMQKKTHFADVTLPQTRGWVREYEPKYIPKPGEFRSFGLVLDERMRGAAPRSEKPDERESKELPPRGISFKALVGFFRKGEDLKIDDGCLNSQDRPAECAQLNTLIFGSGYGLDHLETPYGTLDGVDIHAAIAACPKAGIDHRVLFLLEIALGMFILAPVFERGWKRYFETTTGKAALLSGQRALLPPEKSRWRRCLAAITPTQPQAAYLWIVLTALAALFILALVLLANSVWWSFGDCPVLEVPFGLIVGMFIDAAITSNVEVSSEELTTLQGEVSRLGPMEATDFSAKSTVDIHFFIKAAIYLALLASAVINLWNGH